MPRIRASRASLKTFSDSDSGEPGAAPTVGDGSFFISGGGGAISTAPPLELEPPTCTCAGGPSSTLLVGSNSGSFSSPEGPPTLPAGGRDSANELEAGMASAGSTAAGSVGDAARVPLSPPVSSGTSSLGS